MIETAFSDNVKMELTKALLLYEGGNRSYATTHVIVKGPKGSLSIGEGTPVNVGMLSVLMEKLGRNTAVGGFIPPHILSAGFDSLVWWTKPANRRVFFKTTEKVIGERSEVTPHPGLIFGINSSGKWAVYAVRGGDRPQEDTPLYQAPYFNVWNTGNICRGTVDLPESISTEDTARWEENFFASNFTHPNVHQSMKLVKRKSGPYRFWKSVLDGKYETFPENALVPANITLKDFIKNVGGGAA